MAPSRPDIPKKLAARVRGAQARATELRDSLIHNHKRRLQAQAELDVFHRDPEGLCRGSLRQPRGRQLPRPNPNLPPRRRRSLSLEPHQ